MVYLITYDLNKQGQDYENVIQAIKNTADFWCTYWKSSFLIKTNLPTADEVFDKIQPYIDGNDQVLVIEVKNNKQGWLSEKQWKFINKSIFS